jgi:hypothetical protein
VTSRPDEVNGFLFNMYLIFPAALHHGVYSAPNRNQYQKPKKKFLGSRARPVRKADNFTAISGDCLTM